MNYIVFAIYLACYCLSKYSKALNTPTLREAVTILNKRFAAANSDAPRLCAQVLLAHVLQVDGIYLATNPQTILSSTDWASLNALALRHEHGEPLAYVIGYKEFFGRKFFLNEHTLIPRPASEDMLEAALSKLENKAVNFVDIGTGSGCLGISVAAELTKSYGVLIDIQAQALEMARENTNNLGVSSRVKLVQGDLSSLPLAKNSLDLIITNPPYVSEHEYITLLPNVKNFEPKIALVPSLGGIEDKNDELGLAHIKFIAKQAFVLLKKHGLCVIEHGYTQGAYVKKILEENGQWLSIETGKDLAGLDRYCICKR